MQGLSNTTQHMASAGRRTQAEPNFGGEVVGHDFVEECNGMSMHKSKSISGSALQLFGVKKPMM